MKSETERINHKEKKMKNKTVVNKGFGRISIPLVTPFKKNEEVNYEVYAQLIDYVIKNKCGDVR